MDVSEGLYADLTAIDARVIRADDLKAEPMAAAENLKREDRCAIEAVEAI